MNKEDFNLAWKISGLCMFFHLIVLLLISFIIEIPTINKILFFFATQIKETGTYLPFPPSVYRFLIETNSFQTKEITFCLPFPMSRWIDPLIWPFYTLLIVPISRKIREKNNFEKGEEFRVIKCLGISFGSFIVLFFGLAFASLFGLLFIAPIYIIETFIKKTPIKELLNTLIAFQAPLSLAMGLSYGLVYGLGSLLIFGVCLGIIYMISLGTISIIRIFQNKMKRPKVYKVRFKD